MYEDQHDDYNAIMMKALADRFAEALAEVFYEVIRTNIWGYSKGETLNNEALIAEKYKGIRPAPGDLLVLIIRRRIYYGRFWMRKSIRVSF